MFSLASSLICENRRVYQQTALATVAGYVYCLLYFLGGGRLLPTTLLHAVNNIAAPFFLSTVRQRHDASGSGASSHRLRNSFNGQQVNFSHSCGATDSLNANGTCAITKDCSQWNPAGVLATANPCPRCSLPVDDRSGKTPYDAPEVCRKPAVGGVVPRAGVREIASRTTDFGYAATVVAYLIAGRVCHTRLRRVTTEAAVCSGTDGVGGTAAASIRPPNVSSSTRPR